MLNTYKKLTDAFKWDGTHGSTVDLRLWIAEWSAHTVEFRGGDAIYIDGQEIWPGDYVIRNMNNYPHVIAGRAFDVTYTLA